MTKKLFAFVAFMALLLTTAACGGSKLEASLDEANEKLPMDLGMGMTMEKVVLDGDYVVFTITCPTELYQGIAANKDAFVQGVKGSVSDEDIKVFKDENKGVKYVFKNSDNGEETSVEIAPENL